MTVENSQIDQAVSPTGTPNRTQTNQLLKDLRDIAQAGQFAASFVQRVPAPADGSNVTVNQVKQNGIVILEPVTDLTSLSLRLPAAPNQRDGQIIRLVTTQNIASLTFVGASLLNGIDSMLANDAFAFQLIEENKWVRTVG